MEPAIKGILADIVLLKDRWKGMLRMCVVNREKVVNMKLRITVAIAYSEGGTL